MNIDIFTLCDSVNCYTNKMVVVGNYDIITLPNLTGTPTNINIAGHIIFEEEECGDRNIRIEAVHIESGLKVLDIADPIRIDIREPFKTGSLNIALNAIPVFFQNEGKYKFSLFIDDKECAKTFLNVLIAR